jgi:hypothetical protein
MGEHNRHLLPLDTYYLSDTMTYRGVSFADGSPINISKKIGAIGDNDRHQPEDNLGNRN